MYRHSHHPICLSTFDIIRLRNFCPLNRWEMLFHGFCFTFSKLLISLGLNICWLFVFLLRPVVFYYLSSFFSFWSHWVAYGILVPPPGIEPHPLHWKHNHWTSREIPFFLILWYYIFKCNFAVPYMYIYSICYSFFICFKYCILICHCLITSVIVLVIIIIIFLIQLIITI